ncbi:hypothetical protein [Halalkalirubrum salinum]|uniref:hypothetical protein n=1 Tax=Halalkalirubrum salinum TaxID=2563889 RepID=UPI0010FB1DBE|nr:hypothetical protein [Halalkalirubrum salinum]
MADTKEGRENQADREEKRQQEREMAEARTRADEVEPPVETVDETEGAHGKDDDSPDSPRQCHRRGCDEPATFAVLERYQEETGHGAVEAMAVLCQDHADEESPTNLDSAYEDYVFQVKPLTPTSEPDRV